IVPGIGGDRCVVQEEGRAALDIGQRAPVRPEDMAETAGDGPKGAVANAAVRGYELAGIGEAGIGAVAIDGGDVRLDPEEPARPRNLPVVSRLHAGKSLRDANGVAVDRGAVGVGDVRHAKAAAKV